MITGRRRDGRSLWLVGVALTSIAGLTLADEVTGREAKRLDGTWKFVSLRSDGDDAPKDFVEKGRWLIRDKQITVPDRSRGASRISIKLDPSRSPKAMDLTALDGATKGKTIECIYKIEGDRLTICLPEGRRESTGQPRPKEFGGGGPVPDGAGADQGQVNEAMEPGSRSKPARIFRSASVRGAMANQRGRHCARFATVGFRRPGAATP
jgi:uncharacterized protein (TIGR03067 family)